MGTRNSLIQFKIKFMIAQQYFRLKRRFNFRTLSKITKHTLPKHKKNLQHNLSIRFYHKKPALFQLYNSAWLGASLEIHFQLFVFVYFVFYTLCFYRTESLETP